MIKKDRQIAKIIRILFFINSSLTLNKTIFEYKGHGEKIILQVKK